MLLVEGRNTVSIQSQRLSTFPIEDIILKNSDLVYKLAYARTKNQADAEDLYQEVFLRTLHSQPQFNSDEHCKAWLIRVTVNCSINFFSSLWRKNVILTESPLKEGISNNPVYANPEKSEVFYAVMALPEKYRIIIHLYYYEDYSIVEIGEMLNRKEATVKTQLHRARKLLKQNLKGEYDYV